MALNKKSTEQTVSHRVLDGRRSFTSKPINLVGNVDCSSKKSKAWFLATELQSDLIVEIGNVRFHLQKFPLLSRSGRLNRCVFESRTTERYNITLHDSPGGPEAFELAAQFCYGMDVVLDSSNIASVRCVAEYLEMTDDLEEGNLITKSEAFLSNFVFPSWKNSITVLQSCEHLYPSSENLKIVQRCCESIAWKACTDPQSIKSPHSKIVKTNRTKADQTVKHRSEECWFEDLAVLQTQYFVRVITAMKAKGMKPDLLGAAITHYAFKRFPNFIKDHSSSDYLLTRQSKEVQDDAQLTGRSYEELNSIKKQGLDLLEGIVSILPCEENAVPNNFLIYLIRVAKELNADLACKRDLEKRFGWQLEYANLSDLLVPTLGCEYDTLFDVELIQRLVEIFLLKENGEQVKSPRSLCSEQQSLEESPKSMKTKQATWTRVIKLLDSYLLEVAKDRNLSLTRFQSFAELIPESARDSHDGLYRAIDVFLETHPNLSEQERKKLCRIMDCRKLSSEACMHAAQNDRLPLRIVVQILMGEHLKVRKALPASGKEPSDVSNVPYGRHKFSHETKFEDGRGQADGWTAVQQEMTSMRVEMDNMKSRFSEFLNEYNSFQQEMNNLAKQNILLSWLGGWKKLKLPRFYLQLGSRERDKGSAKGDGSTSGKRLEQWKLRNQRHSLS